MGLAGFGGHIEVMLMPHSKYRTQQHGRQSEVWYSRYKFAFFAIMLSSTLFVKWRAMSDSPLWNLAGCENIKSVQLPHSDHIQNTMFVYFASNNNRDFVFSAHWFGSLLLVKSRKGVWYPQRSAMLCFVLVAKWNCRLQTKLIYLYIYLFIWSCIHNYPH